MTLEQIASALRQRDQGGAPVFVAIKGRYRSDQFGCPKPLDVAVPQVSRPSAIIEELVHRDDAKSADRGQCSNLGATQFEGVTVEEHPFALAATRQVEALAKHVPSID